MSHTSEVIYQGNLRTSSTHLRSGATITTDAPVDNNGKGEAFSPTDTVATALASCMITIMGIKADAMDLDITGTKAEVTKVMSSDPRRISEVIVHVYMPEGEYSDKDKKILEAAALACPVGKSLHPDLEQKIEFHWR